MPPTTAQVVQPKPVETAPRPQPKPAEMPSPIKIQGHIPF